MSLSVATSNAGIKLSGPGQSWSKVDIWTRNGDIRTTDDAKFALGGIFNAQSTNGRIELGAISLAAGAKVDLDSTYGGITLGAAPATSTSAFSIKLFSVDGGATVKMPSNSSFTYSLSTTSGSKTVMGAKGASSGVNGDSKAAQDRAINIGTVNSDIKITTL
ncbi:hypothetical protein BC828DRAFT_377008 [Blastocladiella britannica]|nr:hypothetical protein BC828DRAFT_377008 [Blastocladiella britannica]